jgi:hypothetical protein
MNKAISSQRLGLCCRTDTRPRARVRPRARKSVFLPTAMTAHELSFWDGSDVWRDDRTSIRARGRARARAG